ncbi:hypothetical protein [Streptomyces sp. NPDC001980]|uniref:hypothetical protein n=1 Tax=Streptomyces sp. NPDC001980 TaxID=3157126 RepID=UPI00331C188A
MATALATGVAPGLPDTSRGVIDDLHAALREAVRRRLGGGENGVRGGYGVRVLDAYETDPDVWRARLLQVLTASRADMDEEILMAARAVVRADRRADHVIVDAVGS